jgi:hypothetical protein
MAKALSPGGLITVVSGLPRSGTSLMMQMLAAGGLPALTDKLRPPDESNPRGYFEFEPVKRLRTDTAWLAQAPGHAVKVIHLLLRELPTDGRFQYRVLFMKRPIEEVLASQRVMLERQGKKSGDDVTLVRIYQDQIRQIETWLAAQGCFQVSMIDYHQVLNRPAAIAQEINTFLQAQLDIQAMASVVDPNLHHQRAAD